MKINQTNLLLILGLLIGLRFVVIPVLEWQQGQVIQLEQTLSQLNKAKAMIGAESAFTTKSKQTEQDILKTDEWFFDSTVMTKVNLQQQTERLFAQHNIQIEALDWILEDSQNNIHKKWLQLRIKGELPALAELKIALAQNMPRIYVQELRIRRQNSRKESIDSFQGNISLQFLLIDNKVTPKKHSDSNSELNNEGEYNGK